MSASVSIRSASIVASLRYAVVRHARSPSVPGSDRLARHRRRARHGRLLDAGLMLPLGTSAVTIGLGMLITFDTPPFDWRAAWWLVPLGHALVAMPFVVRSLLSVLRADPGRPTRRRRHARRLTPACVVDVEARRLRRPLRPAPASPPRSHSASSAPRRSSPARAARAAHRHRPVARPAGELPRAQAFALATVLMLVTAAVVMVADRSDASSDA